MSRKAPFNIVFVGESGVGKTSLLLRFCFDKFKFESPTICTAYLYHEVQVSDGTTYHLELVDTAGQERFRPIVPNFYRRAQGAFVVFDLRKRQTFLEAKLWVRELRQNAPDIKVILLVGNKLDWTTRDKRDVRKEEVEKFTDMYGLCYFEVSARTGANVKSPFVAMAEKLAKKEAEHQRFLEAIRLHEEAERLEEEALLKEPRRKRIAKETCCPL